MFTTLGVTRTPATLVGSGGGVGVGKVVIDRVVVDGFDGGSVVGCVGEKAGPAHQRNGLI